MPSARGAAGRDGVRVHLSGCAASSPTRRCCRHHRQLLSIRHDSLDRSSFMRGAAGCEAVLARPGETVASAVARPLTRAPRRRTTARTTGSGPADRRPSTGRSRRGAPAARRVEHLGDAGEAQHHPVGLTNISVIVIVTQLRVDPARRPASRLVPRRRVDDALEVAERVKGPATTSSAGASGWNWLDASVPVAGEVEVLGSHDAVDEQLGADDATPGRCAGRRCGWR